MSKRNHRAAFGGGGVTHNSLIVKVCKGLKNKFNRLFDEKSNSNTLHGYKPHVILSEAKNLKTFYVHFFFLISRQKEKVEPKKKNTND